MVKRLDLTRKRFGKLIVIECAGINKDGRALWLCICDCNKEITTLGKSLVNGSTKSCGCITTAKDLTNQKFNRLTVIERTGSNKYKQALWRCKCDCGNEKIVVSYSLIQGTTVSCGCYGKEQRINAHKKPYCEAAFNVILEKYKRRAKEYKREFSLSESEFRMLTQSKCHYCGKVPSQIVINKFENGNYIYNGIDRVNSTKGYTIDNVVPCCAQCNRLKSDYNKTEFYGWIEAIYKNLHLDKYQV